MHTNSLKAYHEEKPNLSRRAVTVYGFLVQNGPATDRQIMKELGFPEPNAVRPRITELIQDDWVIEVDAVRCPVTGKKVRVSKALSAEARAARIREKMNQTQTQGELFV